MDSVPDNDKPTLNSIHELVSYILHKVKIEKKEAPPQQETLSDTKEEKENMTTPYIPIIIKNININCDFQLDYLLQELKGTILENTFNIEEDGFIFLHSYIEIENVVFQKTANFQSIRFYNGFRIQGAIFVDNFSMYNCEFVNKDLDSFIDLIPFIFLADLYFKKECVFEACDFHINFSLCSSVFHYIRFETCKFLNKTDFSDITSVPKQLSNTQIDDFGLIFIRVKIESEFSILDSTIISEIFFEEITSLNPSTYIKIAGINLFPNSTKNTIKNLGKLTIINSRIYGDILLYDIGVKTILLKNNLINGVINENNLSYSTLQDKDTAVTLKRFAIRQGNNFLINRYKAAESDISLIEDYKEFRTKKILKPSRIEKILKRKLHKNYITRKAKNFILITLTSLFSREMFLLWLNKYSNNFGLDWFRGVKFTMIVAMIFYWLINYLGMDKPLFVLDWHFTNFGEVWKGYLNILNVVNWGGQLNGFELNAIGESLFFLSKIFIAYGVYQTISAFRKYGK